MTPKTNHALASKSTDIASEDPTILAMVAYVIRVHRMGRLVTAALALARLREHFEALGPQAYTEWDRFSRQHLEPALGLDLVRDLIGQMVHRNGPLRCTACNALAKAPCGCGVNYAPEGVTINVTGIPRRGRPSTNAAKTGAERMRELRDRRRSTIATRNN